MLDITPERLCLVNCYYDFTSAVFKCKDFATVRDAIVKKLDPLGLLKIKPFGCTAFAYDTPNGPVHARNMDWCDYNNQLSEQTTIIHHKGRLREDSFKTISWAGISGVLSAIKKGYFTITLNMTSCDEFDIGQPVVFLIRRVLEESHSFDQAVKILSEEDILSDCLLLVTGINQGEMVVIERTPTNSFVRYPTNGYIAVANEYVKHNPNKVNKEHLVEKSAGRYGRITELLEQSKPTSMDNCFDYLDDDKVKLSITLQQMVMCANTGELKVRRATK